MKINRRSFLRDSALVTSSAALTGPALLTARPSRAQTSTAPRIIAIFADGGWDTTYTIDPKEPSATDVDIPNGSATTSGFGATDLSISNAVSQAGAFFTQYYEQIALVRGIDVRSIAHDTCRTRIWTGGASIYQPDFASLVASTHARELALPYVLLSGSGFIGGSAAYSARLGTANQIVSLVDDQETWKLADETAPASYFNPQQDKLHAIEELVKKRASRLAHYRGAYGENKRKLFDYEESLNKLQTVRENSHLLGEKNPAKGLDNDIALAVDLLSNGLSHSVSINDGGSWDSHDGNTSQGSNHGNLFGDTENEGLRGLMKRLDLTTFVDGALAGQKLIDHTVVVVFSEMGRTPLLNNGGGKDHWGFTSAMVIGSMVAPGAYGGTDPNNMSGLNVNFESGKVDGGTLQALGTAEFISGILDLAQVPSDQLLSTPFSPYKMS